jgi:ATP-dependent DNA helicase PIF1
MDSQQQSCVDAVLRGDNVFLTGSAGTGKSFTIQHLEEILQEHPKKKISITAMTGCAAILLSPRARTLHSWGGIGLGKESMEDLVIRVRKNKQAAERWRTTQVLVVDEVSMLGPTLFEKLEGVARKIRKCEKFFGGITLVLSGDFFQLPPVDEPTFLFQSPVFRRGIQRVIDLQTIYRQKDDQTWYGVLQNIRKGQLSDTDISLLQSRLLSDPVKNVPATVLYPVNRKVDSLNDAALQRLGKPVRELKVRVARGNLTKLSDVEPMRQRMGVPSVLHLAEGAHVILTWNLDVEAGLVNGSQGVVTGFSARGYPIVDFRKVGEMEVETMEYAEEGEWQDKDYKIAFHQFPLKLSWALSIHKVQGHNLDAALMDLGSEIFECGQAYVALSRIKKLEGVWLSSLDPHRIRAHPEVVDYYASL